MSESPRQNIFISGKNYFDFSIAKAYPLLSPGNTKKYLPVKRMWNKFLVLPGDNNGYADSKFLKDRMYHGIPAELSILKLEFFVI